MEAPTHAPRSHNRFVISIILAALVVLFVYWSMEFYTVPPIGAIPQGGTVVVWRASGEPFFNSPDAVCLKVQNGVSLLCRGMALTAAPIDRIVLRLPYMHWAYLMSTGGLTFDR